MGRTPSKKISKSSFYKNWFDTIKSGRFNSNTTDKGVLLPKFDVDKLDSLKGKLTTYTDHQSECLQRLGSFRPNQFRELFPTPMSLVRESTILRLVHKLTDLDSNERKFVLTGEPGVGKSTTLAQLQAWALDKKYLLISLSYPRLIMDGLNDFQYNEISKLYEQPMFLKKHIGSIKNANDPKILKSIVLQNDYSFTKTDLTETNIIDLHKDKNTLFDLLSVKPNANLLGTQYEGIMTEIYSQREIPILYTVDNFSYILTNSYTKYCDTEGKSIPALRFQIVDKFMKLISGQTKLVNPLSAIITSISGDDRTNHTLPVALGKKPLDPYITQPYLDQEYVKLLQMGSVKEFPIEKFHKDEVAALMEYCTKLQLPLSRDTGKTIDEIVNEKYFISGNGNCREIFKSMALNYR